MLRLFLAVILLLLIALLAVFPAPASVLWMVAVIIESFPYVFMLLSIVVFLNGLSHERFKTVILICSAISFLLYSIPIATTYYRSKNLPAQIAKVFPAADLKGELKEPFSFIKMFTGVGVHKVAFKNIIYKILPEKKLSFDFYPSKTPGKSPLVIVIHGGAWEKGNSRQLPALNNYLAERGYNVASINYRLAPNYQSPAPIEDTKDALTYLTQHAAELNIDTNNIVLLGRSAGAQIALVAAYTFHDPHIKGVVSFYGPADMVWGGQIRVNQLVLNTDRIYKDFFGGNYDQVPEKFKEASACEYADTSSPPTLMIQGTIDPLVSYHHSEHLQAKLDSVHVKNYFLDLPLATHGCDFNINGPYGQISTYAVERFINSVTK